MGLRAFQSLFDGGNALGLATVRLFLDNVTFSDGGTATGSFNSDDFSGFDITTSPSGPFGAHFTPSDIHWGNLGSAFFSGYQFRVAINLGGGLEEVIQLLVYENFSFTSPNPLLTSAAPGTPSYDVSYEDITGPGADDNNYRYIVSGYIVAGSLPPPPTLEPDRAHVQKGHSVTADAAHGVLANDSDPIPNDALTVSEVNGQASNVGIAVAGAYGKLTLNANGSYTYVATAHDKALPSDGVGLDTFTYTAKDGVGDTADTALTVVVTAPGIAYLGGTANTTIQGANHVKQVLDGGAGNDVVIAGTGTQVLIGGPGDTLTGAHGADTFVFPPNFGNETITNFDVHHDTIQLPHSEFDNIAAVLADAHQVGANVQIAPDAHDVITLNNLTAHQLHASNFHLV